MTKKTATILTIVGALLALCLSLTCCGVGAYNAYQTMNDGQGLTGSGPTVSYLLSAVGLCLGILIWLLPLLLWIFLVRGKSDEGAPPAVV